MRGLHATRALMMFAASFWFTGWATAGQPIKGIPLPVPIWQGAILAELEGAKMPSGFADLCARDPSICRRVEGNAAGFALLPQRWEMIDNVNTSVNHRITSVTDQKLYGQSEFWVLPTTAGDCEDYVLLKRKLLLEEGFPEDVLLITVVQDENGEGHAVLTIPVADGDIVLDNRRDDILRWWATGYKFVKRQSAANPAKWVALAKDKLQATNIASAPEAP